MNLIQPHAPPDKQCDRAFDQIVKDARAAGVSCQASKGVAALALTDDDHKDAAKRDAWEAAMKPASEHCLITQAYGGTAVLATPAQQRKQGLRKGILSGNALSEPEDRCNKAFTEVIRDARKAGWLQTANERIAEVVESKSDPFKELLAKARSHALVARIVYLPRSGQECPVYLLATPAAQRSGEAREHRFSHSRLNTAEASPEPACEPM